MPNAGAGVPVSTAFDVVGVPNRGLNGCASVVFSVTFGEDKLPDELGTGMLANGLLAFGSSAAGLGANRLLAGPEGWELEVDPKRVPKGIAASAGLAGVCSAAVIFGANRLVLLVGACPGMFANGLLNVCCGFSAPKGFEAAGVDPKSGLKGWVSAGFSAGFSDVAVFGANKLLDAFCPGRFANGLLNVCCGFSVPKGFEAAGVDPKSGLKGWVSAGLSAGFSGAAGLCEKMEAPLGLLSGEVCMFSSAGEVICVVDCPNRAGFAGVLVFCCAPNPPNDGVD